MRICKLNQCDKKHDSHGYCANHARQFKRWGRIRTKEELSAEIAERNARTKPNLGKKWSDEAKKAQSERLKGRTLNTGKTHFRKGHRGWNKGLSGWMSAEHKEKLRLANLGKIPWNKGTRGLMPKPHNKIGDGITPINRIERNKFQKTTQTLVFQRDDYTCQVCEKRGGYLQVDHIKRWADYPELRFKLDNCRTVCMACHYYITFKRKIPEGVIWGHNLSRRI